MPEGEDDMSWHQIKEALPPMELTKQIYRLTNTLSTPMQTQCNLLSLDVFRDESELKPVSTFTWMNQYLKHFLRSGLPNAAE